MFFSRGILKSQISAPPPLRFPQKLWKIANECQTGAVTWSPDGRSILVRYSLFREEFMSTKNDFFKTDNISSFVRQLNLYGFRKGHEYSQKPAYKSNPDLHEFSNVFFQRDRPELLDKVTRKSGVLRDRNDAVIESKKTKLDLGDDSSSEKWDTINTATENTDHTYLSTQKSETSNSGVLEQETSAPANPSKDKEAIPESLETDALADQPTEAPAAAPAQSSAAPPAKKKRGRKPGSKTNPSKLKAAKFKRSRKDYFSPVMKNPSQWPGFVHFDDEDDSVFLRNTSRDVMLSSTMSFQETVESLALKEVLLRMRSQRSSGHGLIMVS